MDYSGKKFVMVNWTNTITEYFRIRERPSTELEGVVKAKWNDEFKAFCVSDLSAQLNRLRFENLSPHFRGYDASFESWLKLSGNTSVFGGVVFDLGSNKKPTSTTVTTAKTTSNAKLRSIQPVIDGKRNADVEFKVRKIPFYIFGGTNGSKDIIPGQSQIDWLFKVDGVSGQKEIDLITKCTLHVLGSERKPFDQELQTFYDFNNRAVILIPGKKTAIAFAGSKYGFVPTSHVMLK